MPQKDVVDEDGQAPPNPRSSFPSVQMNVQVCSPSCSTRTKSMCSGWTPYLKLLPLQVLVKDVRNLPKPHDEDGARRSLYLVEVSFMGHVSKTNASPPPPIEIVSM